MVEMNQRVNIVLLEVASAVSLTPEQVDDCAERWKAGAGCGIDLRDALPEDMAHLADDALYLTRLRQILEAYKKIAAKGKRGSR